MSDTALERAYAVIEKELSIYGAIKADQLTSTILTELTNSNLVVRIKHKELTRSSGNGDGETGCYIMVSTDEEEKKNNKIKKLEKQIAVKEKIIECERSLTETFCPDCRDKWKHEGCPRCNNQSLERVIAKLEKRISIGNNIMEEQSAKIELLKVQNERLRKILSKEEKNT